MNLNTNNKIRTILALILGIGLIVALFNLHSLDLTSLKTLKPSWPYIAAMFICSIIYVMLGGWKWQLISKQWHGEAPGIGFHFSQSAQTMLLSQFLPLPVATALQRAAVLRIKHNIPVTRGIVHAVYDLGFEFMIALLLVPATLLQLYTSFSFTSWLASGIFALVACIFMAWKSRNILLWLAKMLSRKKASEKIGEWLYAWKKHGLLAPRFIILMILISTARFAVLTLRLCVGATAMGLIIPWDAITYTTPLATIPALIPITPANLGVAEWSWAYLLSLWEVPVAAGVLYATGFRILTLAVQAVIAAIAYPFGNNPEKIQSC